jgi:UDP-arabinose 4-epimerase
VRVLVTGGAGYIGSHACKALSRAGHEPVVFDNLSTGHAWAVKWGPLVNGDLCDMREIRRAVRDHRVEAVIHFAASAYVGESMQNPRKYFRNNVANSLNLLESMLEEGVRRIVFSSSCATYGIPDSLPITEESPQRPINPYGESKLFVERALKWYGEAYGLKWIALRYFNAAGADPGGDIGEDHEPETHLIPLVVRATDPHEPAVSICGADYPTRDGTAIRDYTHVCDLADAHVRALGYLSEARVKSLGVNLGTGNGTSVRDILQAVERHAGIAPTSIQAARRPGDPAQLVAANALARRLLGWSPVHSDIDSIVSSALRWHRRLTNSGTDSLWQLSASVPPRRQLLPVGAAES